MVAIGQQSVASTSNLFFGFWSHLEAIQDPLGSPTSYYLGVGQDAVLEISREDAEYLGTTFPQRVEIVIPQRAGMKMTGRFDEITAPLLHLLVGNLPGTAGNYIYPGTSCPDETKYVRFVARRIRCDGFVMEALFWKAQSAGLVQLGAAPAGEGTPFDISALDDVNGGWGGNATAPLGYVYAPSPAP